MTRQSYNGNMVLLNNNHMDACLLAYSYRYETVVNLGCLERD